MTETMPNIKVEKRKVADLIPFARNSRTHSDEQVAQWDKADTFGKSERRKIHSRLAKRR